MDADSPEKQEMSPKPMGLQPGLPMFACVPGHFMIVALFSVHRRFEKHNRNTSWFDDEIDYDTVVAIQAFLASLHQINEEYEGILTPKGYKIGAYLIDDRNNETVAQHRMQQIYEQTYILSNVTDPCSLNPKRKSPIIAMFAMSPEIRFSRDVRALANTLKIPYLKSEHRKVSTISDSFIVVHMLRWLGWTYVYLLYSENIEEEARKFETKAESYKICISMKRSVIETTKQEYYEEIVGDLSSDDRSNVIVIISWSTTIINGLFAAMDRLNVTDRFMVVSSEEWLPLSNSWISHRCRMPKFLILDKSPSTFRPTANERLRRRYFSSNANNTLNPWLKIFAETQLDCAPLGMIEKREGKSNCPSGAADDILTPRVNTALSRFTPHQLRMFEMIINFKMFKVWLDSGKCDDEKYTTVLLNSLLNVSESTRSTYFEYWMESGNNDYLDESETKPFLIEIWKYYKIQLTLQPDNVSVGYNYWDDSRNQTVFEILDLHKSSLISRWQWACKPGSKKVAPDFRNSCCLTCEACRKDEILSPNNTCVKCPKGMQPSEKQSECLNIKVEPRRWNDFEILISVTYSVVVIILALITLIIFIRHRNTPVVKSSTRELSFMMLIAIVATESTVFLIMSKSSTFSCASIRIILLVSFTTLYAALLVKTVRIARLFVVKQDRFPRLNKKWMSSKSQMVITLILIAIEFVLVLIVLYMDPAHPELLYDYNLEPPIAVPVCTLNVNVLVYNFSFISLLVLLCTACAVWTRNIPHNFNEAKYIGFCMYSTCLTWIGFGLTYYTTEFKVITLYASASTNALVTLIFLFFPKLYIIIMKPERNDTKYFNTVTGIRFHKGRRDSLDLEFTETYSLQDIWFIGSKSSSN